MKTKTTNHNLSRLLFGSLLVMGLTMILGHFQMFTASAATVNSTVSSWSVSALDKPTIDGVVANVVFPATGVVGDLQPGGSYFIENSTLNDTVGAGQNDGRGVWMPLNVPECAIDTNAVFNIDDRVAAAATPTYTGNHVFAYGIVQDTDGSGPAMANVIAGLSEPSPSVPYTSLPQSVTSLTSGNINPSSNTGLYAIIMVETNKTGDQIEWQIDGATVTVTYDDSQCTPSTPVATPEATTTQPGKPVTYNVLPNDSDPENDTLTVTSANITSGDTLGSVSFTADGNITYTPSAGFTGTTVITYTISDGNGGTASSTLSITITAGVPGVPNTGLGGDDSQNISPLVSIITTSVALFATLLLGRFAVVKVFEFVCR